MFTLQLPDIKAKVSIDILKPAHALSEIDISDVTSPEKQTSHTPLQIPTPTSRTGRPKILLCGKTIKQTVGRRRRQEVETEHVVSNTPEENGLIWNFAETSSAILFSDTYPASGGRERAGNSKRQRRTISSAVPPGVAKFLAALHIKGLPTSYIEIKPRLIKSARHLLYFNTDQAEEQFRPRIYRPLVRKAGLMLRPETKRQSAQRVFPFEELPTKVKRGRSVGKKTMASFFGMTGHHATSVLEEKTVTAE
ncbi:hypothetical protein EVAR_76696_1 [Eumeta japonica]|uniref:Uncharacterized protein n=1 Tax=Eumeta variegata TaxID=151549 RepID=A0A4C1SSS6_EUMVA|nr:hypothetical protein EVAR_76696_1 [Eumeta japonica]